MLNKKRSSKNEKVIPGKSVEKMKQYSNIKKYNKCAMLKKNTTNSLQLPSIPFQLQITQNSIQTKLSPFHKLR